MFRLSRVRLSQFGRQPQRLVRRPKPQLLRQTPEAQSAPIPKTNPTPGPSPRQRLEPNYVVGSVIGLCVAVWAWHANEVSAAPLKTDRYGRTYRDGTRLAAFYDNFVMSKRNIDAGRWWTMVTSSFTHFSLLHLGVNMWGVWQVGRLVVLTYGTATFGLVWISSSVAGDLLSLSWSNLMEKAVKYGLLSTPIGPAVSDGNHIGASGSLCGLLGVGACAYPLLLRSSAIGVVAFSVVCLVGDFLPQLGHVSHMGGLANGAAFWLLFLSRRGRIGPGRI